MTSASGGWTDGYLHVQFHDSGCRQGRTAYGAGLGGGQPPVLGSTDTLTVVVKWAGQNSTAPAQLTGYFVISAAPASPATQVAPSPFLNGSNYTCFAAQTASASTGPGAVTYTFTGLQYGGGQPGKYELTFTAQAGTIGQPGFTQWSADPEFDTSS